MIKKTTLLFLVATVLFGCSPEADTTTESPAIDLSMLVNPNTVLPEAKYDTTEKGIYRGIFVGNDMSHHGELTVNVQNDGHFNAVLVTTDAAKFGFVGYPFFSNSLVSKVVFHGEDQSKFILNLTHSEEPIIEEAFIAGKPATAKVLKETSQNSVMISLGTYTDDSDPSFNGTWDFLSTETEVITIPTGQPFPFPATVDITVNIISELVLVTAGGGMFTDTAMEEFMAGAVCPATFPTGSQRPFFSGEQTIGGVVEINEFAAGNQSSPLNGTDASWTFLYSFANGSAYYDIDCNVLTAGTWSWNGRTGSILLD